MIEHTYVCPYCFEDQHKLVDFSIRQQKFIEDCEVCCNPIEFIIQVSNGEIEQFEALNMD